MDTDTTGLEQNSVTQSDTSLNRLSRVKPPLPKKPPVSQKPTNITKPTDGGQNKDRPREGAKRVTYDKWSLNSDLPGKPSRAPPALPKTPPKGHSNGNAKSNAPLIHTAPRKPPDRNPPCLAGEKLNSVKPICASNDSINSDSTDCGKELDCNVSGDFLSSNHVTHREESYVTSKTANSNNSKDNKRLPQNVSPSRKKVPPSISPKPKLQKSPSTSSPSPQRALPSLQRTSSKHSIESVSESGSQGSFEENVGQSTFYTPVNNSPNAVSVSQDQDCSTEESNGTKQSPAWQNPQINSKNVQSKPPSRNHAIMNESNSLVTNGGTSQDESIVSQSSNEIQPPPRRSAKSPRTPPKPPPKRVPSKTDLRKVTDDKRTVCDHFSNNGSENKLIDIGDSVTIATPSRNNIKQKLENIISPELLKTKERKAASTETKSDLENNKSQNLVENECQGQSSDQDVVLRDKKNLSGKGSSPRSSGTPSPVPRTLKPSPKTRPKPRKRLSLNRQSGMDQSDEGERSSCSSADLSLPVTLLPSGDSNQTALPGTDMSADHTNNEPVGSGTCNIGSNSADSEISISTVEDSKLIKGDNSENNTVGHSDSETVQKNSEQDRKIVNQTENKTDGETCDVPGRSDLTETESKLEGTVKDEMSGKEGNTENTVHTSLSDFNKNSHLIAENSKDCIQAEKMSASMTGQVLDDHSGPSSVENNWEVCSQDMQSAKEVTECVSDQTGKIQVSLESKPKLGVQDNMRECQENPQQNIEKFEKTVMTEKFSMSVEEPPLTETSSLLDEIEQLVNKRMSELVDRDMSTDSGTEKQMLADSQMPVRPPRPKRDKKRSQSELYLQSNSGSHTGSTTSLNSDIVIPPASSTKTCPPKPKRNRLPKVNRSHSDVSGMKLQTDRSQEESGDSDGRECNLTCGIPALPLRMKSLNMQVPANQHQLLKEIALSEKKNASSTSKQSAQVGEKYGNSVDVRASPKLQSTKRNLRPSRKAPPPPKVVAAKLPDSNKSGSSNKQEDKITIVTTKTVSLDGTGVFEYSSVSDHEYHEIDYSAPPDSDSRCSSLTGRNSNDSGKDLSLEKSPSPPDLPPRNSICSQSTNDSLSSLEVNDKGRPVSAMSMTSFMSSHSESGSIGQGSPDHDDMSSSESEEGDTEEEKRMKKKEKKIFFIAREICSSEKVFVDVLKLLNVDFRIHISSATEANGKPVIPNEVLNKILKYLPQLHDFNQSLLKDLEERITHWDEIKQVSDIFVKKGPFLKLYTSYIKDFSEMNEILDEACKRYEPFKTALKSFELSPRCASLALKHYMLKPVQRIPQYKLLLQDYLKHLTEDSPDYQTTLTALNIVSKVADHANDSWKFEDEVQKLLEIQKSLDGNFEVIKPGRELIKQGELMKLSRKEMQPRMFFLFNDVLLYTTPTSSGGYRLNNVLTLAGMKVTQSQVDEFKNEINIISVQRSFTVQASTQEERDQWLKELQKAINDNALKRNTFENVKAVNQSFYDVDYEIGTKAPIWIPDTRVTMCMICTSEFSVTWRRHHCRGCGWVVCSNCSENKAPLEYLRNKPERVCDECYKKLKEVFDKKAKVTEMTQPITQDQDGSLLSLGGLLQRFHKIRKSGRHGSKQQISRPARLKEVHANDQGSTISGNLKTHKSGKKWKKFWFVLKGKVLYTYKASEDMAAIDSLPVVGYDVEIFSEDFEGVKAGKLFKLQHKNRPPIIFQTENQETTGKWIAAMKEASNA